MSHVLKPLHNVVILTNDYFSWEKERAVEKAEPSAVNLYMRWFSMSQSEAKAAIKTKIIELEEEYVKLRSRFTQNNLGSAFSPNVDRWFDIMEVTIAGNLLWSLNCPRYNNVGSNSYQEYLSRRREQGFQFFASCTESNKLISSEGTEEEVLNHLGTEPTNGDLLHTPISGTFQASDGIENSLTGIACLFSDVLPVIPRYSIFKDLSPKIMSEDVQFEMISFR